VNIILKLILNQEIVTNEEGILEIAEEEVASTATRKVAKKTAASLYKEVLEEEQDQIF